MAQITKSGPIISLPSAAEEFVRLNMGLGSCNAFPSFQFYPRNSHPTRQINPRKPEIVQIVCARGRKRCVRCNNVYEETDNSPTACAFHGHATGERGLFSFAPPHQGVDGEWSDESGVIVYRWNERENRPNTGRANWKRRWSCCAEYDENSAPCRRGWHVSYDDGFTLY